jgi:hypothetical protein
MKKSKNKKQKPSLEHSASFQFFNATADKGNRAAYFQDYYFADPEFGCFGFCVKFIQSAAYLLPNT